MQSQIIRHRHAQIQQQDELHVAPLRGIPIPSAQHQQRAQQAQIPLRAGDNPRRDVLHDFVGEELPDGMRAGDDGGDDGQEEQGLVLPEVVRVL